MKARGPVIPGFLPYGGGEEGGFTLVRVNPKIGTKGGTARR